MALQFANIEGKVLTQHQMEATAKTQRKPRPVAEKEPKHKGFRVVGHPPGALESAREDHQRVVDMAAKAGGRESKPWSEQAWLDRTKKKAVRSKPYEVRSAAQQCADLASKAGWTDVSIIELVDEA